MIINESVNKKDYEEFDIVNPKKFISAMGGLVDNGLKESTSGIWKAQMKDTLKSNKMSVPPTESEIKRSGNKIKIPWFLVGALADRVHDWGLTRDN